MALDTVGQIVARARTLLQDTVEPYRYATPDLISALNEACMEAKRLRPDLYLRTLKLSLPSFVAEADTVTEEKIPSEYRTAFIYYIVGNAQLQDEEDTQDQRATVFLNKFAAQMLQVPS
jgi:hypothetical protein